VGRLLTEAPAGLSDARFALALVLARGVPEETRLAAA